MLRTTAWDTHANRQTQTVQEVYGALISFMWVGLPLMRLTDRYLFPLRFLEQSGKGSAEGCSEFISNGHEIREESGNGDNCSWVSWGWAN
ncbi:unnamed protein product [Lactuca virosa]|uniref:Uncharacterized protein n=1 Tax=Lactuca virosa TaxID=75947 RepID=A0AAU9PAC6_9ASTR|nr:unnamed protein product [Lactuca virosa]